LVKSQVSCLYKRDSIVSMKDKNLKSSQGHLLSPFILWKPSILHGCMPISQLLGCLYCINFFTYPLCPKINAILGLGTQTNARCKITKFPLVFCKKDLDIGLSFACEVSGVSCLVWLVGQNCILCETNFEL
jgi:hypothetical protein